jgi:hypothetical protein
MTEAGNRDTVACSQTLPCGGVSEHSRPRAYNPRVLNPVVLIQVSQPFVKSQIIDAEGYPYPIDSSVPALEPGISWLLAQGGGQFVLFEFEPDDIELIA